MPFTPPTPLPNPTDAKVHVETLPLKARYLKDKQSAAPFEAELYRIRLHYKDPATGQEQVHEKTISELLALLADSSQAEWAAKVLGLSGLNDAYIDALSGETDVGYILNRLDHERVLDPGLVIEALLKKVRDPKAKPGIALYRY